MANRHQRRRKAERKRQEAIRDSLIGMGVRERDAIVKRNKATPMSYEDYAWSKAMSVSSNVLLQSRMPTARGGHAKLRFERP